MSGARFSLALLHYPVYDKNGRIVTTSVTNLDIHDIARAARTFGADRYYIVTPVAEQQSLVQRVTTHWQHGWGASYNPKRKAALDMVSVAASLDGAIADMKERSGRSPQIVVTGAAATGCISASELAARFRTGQYDLMLVFGTGWGMTEQVFDAADFVLEPIRGAGDYYHLSVRSAVSIYLDRLFGHR